MGPTLTIALVALTLLGVACRRMLARDRKLSGRTSALTSKLIWVIYSAFTAIVAFAAWQGVWPLAIPYAVLPAAGAVLLLIGLTLLVSGLTAFSSLARATGRDQSRLTRSGVYRWTRNPQNVGWALGLLGLALLGRSGLALLLAGAFWLLFWAYLPTEEKHLERLFGDEWRAYAESTPRFFGWPSRSPASHRKFGAA